MKKMLLIALLMTCSMCGFAQNYVFFLHNMFLELYGVDGVHPEYGKAEYNAIVNSYKNAGFTVISELRPKNTDAKQYAKKVAAQVDSLLKKGIPPSHITVVGTSKGGYIAMYASAILKNTALNFVFIGCCNEDIVADNDIHFYGNILSIYERSDVIGRSCQKEKVKCGKDVKKYKEIELNTGLKHGFLYKPLKEWLEPSIQWAK